MPADDTRAGWGAPSTSHPAGYSPARLDALERRAFTAPFVLVTAHNDGAGTTTDRAEARRLAGERPEVVTIAGTLAPQLWAVDVDPADTGTDPEAGEAAGEELAAWCDGHGLPWLLRASGRPGGRHLIARVPAELLRELRALCRRLAAQHGPACTPRRTLRLLTAPHRAGLDAPVLAGTLTASDLPQHATDPSAASVPAGRAVRRRRRSAAAAAEGDRSAREFGDAIVRARAGWGPGRAWSAAKVPGSKAHEHGELWWRRYVWAVAVTVVAAEDSLSEPEAWSRFQRASPARARQLGLEAWRETYWQPAVAEAGRDRPRRRRLERRPAAEPVPLRAPEELTAEQAEAALLADALREAAQKQADLAGLRPQFAHSVAAAVHALAEAIAVRGGSISTRTWAERARLDPKTLRRARDFAAEHGVLYRARAYAEGTDDTDAWLPGPATTPFIEQRRETSPTRWYTPTADPAPLGQASPERLRHAHATERRLWSLRCELSAAAGASGQTFATSQHPAAKTLRSLWHQRRWWTSLTPDQQEQRRRQRRAMLGALHRSERSAWFDWLARREVVTAAADRAAAVAEPGAADVALLERAPRTIHLGMRDPAWRTGGTPAADPAGEQLALIAA
ncbi:hypothetical protein HFP15_40870 [Amycolatopsis sp. K13G38]|uniref:Primase C-terminal 1 domain-containing protein n=1 Tax=Amycolatopsis acididurans TaxID=2724524 RepID=A0ABX1JHU7_9PSEU|nr:hypothetical protein [Amycolatopsis acididurans]NKQ59211.1 hypothetical protein [Amycolatopsis acididurans]